MDEMNIDRWLALGGVAVGVIGIVVAIAVPLYFYRKSLRPKLLAVSYSQTFPLMISRPGVTVTYLGTERKALSRTYILFWNRGTSPIEHSDFVVSTAFTDPEVIVIEVTRKDPMAMAAVEGRTVKIELLRPTEAIVVKVDSETYNRPNFIMPTKTASMVETIKRIPGVLGILPILSMTVAGLIAFGASIGLLKYLGPQHSAILPFALSPVSLAFGALGYLLGARVMRRLTPVIPYKFLTADWYDVWEEKQPKEQ